MGELERTYMDIYSLYKRVGGWIHDPREARESRSRQFSCVCSFVSLWAFYDCKHYCYWRLMRAVISDCNPFFYISSYLNILQI
jgi:hypothetical protein